VQINKNRKHSISNRIYKILAHKGQSPNNSHLTAVYKKHNRNPLTAFLLCWNTRN